MKALAPDEVLALSVKNPWASLIAAGLKPFEIRTWRTNYRGELLIVSSAAPSRSDDAKRIELATDYVPPNGVAMCLVRLVDCRPFADADARGAWCMPSLCDVGPDAPFGRHTWTSVAGKERCTRCNARREYVWELRDVRAVDDVQIAGRLNFYPVPRSLVRARAVPTMNLTARLR